MFDRILKKYDELNSTNIQSNRSKNKRDKHNVHVINNFGDETVRADHIEKLRG